MSQDDLIVWAPATLHSTETFSIAAHSNLCERWIMYLYPVKCRKAETWDNAGEAVEQELIHTFQAVQTILILLGRKQFCSKVKNMSVQKETFDK